MGRDRVFLIRWRCPPIRWKGTRMLQTVHKRIATPKASSLYCVSVRQGPVPRLEAIWIEAECRPESNWYAKRNSQFKAEAVCDLQRKSQKKSGSGMDLGKLRIE